MASSLKDFVTSGTIDISNEPDEPQYSSYMFTNGKYKLANGISFVYYPGNPEKMAEELPKDVIHAVLKKYGKS